MIELLLPGVVETAYAFADQEVVIHEDEKNYVDRAVHSRRQEFSTVRRCARAAIENLGFSSGPLIPGHRGAPIWPNGLVGSMTHCTGFRAAAVARITEIQALGIDAEPNERLPADPGLLDVVALPIEQQRLTSLTRSCPEVAWDRLLFSAKESVYKAWYPSTRRDLTFIDVDIDFEVSTSTFTAKVLLPDSGFFESLKGRWTMQAGLLVTAICLEQ